MEVVILAGGLGTRLRSEVSDVPKCMAPIDGKPFLWYILEYLKGCDISRVVLSVGYLRDVVIDWVERNWFGYDFLIDIAVEEEPLGTGGGIKNALKNTKERDVIILNGDTMFMVDLRQLYDKHRKNESKITIALKEMECFDRYGSVELEDGYIKCFNEKGYCERGLINGGIYIIDKDSGIMNGTSDKFSFEKDVLEKHCGEKKEIYGVVDDGYFIDIGIPEDYHKAEHELKTIIEN